VCIYSLRLYVPTVPAPIQKEPDNGRILVVMRTLPRESREACVQTDESNTTDIGFQTDFQTLPLTSGTIADQGDNDENQLREAIPVKIKYCLKVYSFD